MKHSTIPVVHSTIPFHHSIPLNVDTPLCQHVESEAIQICEHILQESIVMI